MEKNANSEMPAFGFYSGDALKDMPGLTKREYFAAMAMQGLLANPSSGNDTNALVCCAHDAVRVADFLLQELSTTQP